MMLQTRSLEFLQKLGWGLPGWRGGWVPKLIGVFLLRKENQLLWALGC